MSQASWYLTACIDCGKELKSLGAPPAKPICLHCDLVRYAPDAIRDLIRRTLGPVPEDPDPPAFEDLGCIPAEA
jgi:hypothetical protein